MNQNQFAEIISKLNQISRLLALSAVNGIEALKDQILALSSQGFRPVEIASLLNTTQNQVNVTLSKARKKKVDKITKG